MKPAPPGGEDEAGGEPLKIPLEWSAAGLVEIVDIEDHIAFWGGEAAEVHQVAVAARLHDDSARRRARQIVSLNVGRPAKEGERGLQHPPVADRDQILQPVIVGPFNEGDRVAFDALAHDDLAVRGARMRIPQRHARIMVLFPSPDPEFGHPEHSTTKRRVTRPRVRAIQPSCCSGALTSRKPPADRRLQTSPTPAASNHYFRQKGGADCHSWPERPRSKPYWSRFSMYPGPIRPL